ncbi:DNA-binding CsgD family transcriptional regulator [Dysgonomonas sp. PFB1-18]|uniref:helix-turn-helix domain-containing protein n=1 Tax=unclassified Dysgonomonas TaxID=2630389 RepID=UPI00247338F2|nr:MULTISPECIES: helix-turn-helix transcriptional regulator [unclassified Dysgonomonas]MDH6309186.1 DNA-binding CsgD family transcriptional regulator [Dysgonomonas sp. PF1-14]MDH6338934.1 DNA-binding CsgD family transcriptional regulator [Dysgonomonas sp. PF1-16]MDH6380435.1 DNA-binding CsgD family transcriptional regulator [Dysgonomonas sp. PFB1-18]MDH6397762.1 DNA-binding CsgD family transcriptional regulator [Dysgonomonas sp. PF1-23]
MLFLDTSSILSEVVEENHQLIPVINRFGIKLGLGDKTIGEICKPNNINTEFFLAILNTFLNEDYFPEKKLQKFDIELVVKYIKQTDAYLIHGQLHNLEKHLNAFLSMSDANNAQLKLISRLFREFKQELIDQIEQGMVKGDTPLALLTDLKSIIIKHISGNFNENMCYAVIFTIDSFQKDLEKHNRIREKILKPMLEELSESGMEDLQELIAASHSIKTNKTQALSQRELDVLRLVSLGLLNKEVADKLNISLNTVLSHRKNITAKLGIKTVSGLIFYCITHGYISADEIEL